MTDPKFSRPGAVDLSALAAQAQAASPAHSGAPTGAPGGSYVTDVTEAGFDALARQSMQFPVVLEFWSPRAHGGDQLSADLAALAQAAGGAWLLGRVNVDTEVRIAQSLGVQAVPMVVAVLGGQLMPLFQGTRDKQEITAYLDQVLQTAVANGIVGRAQPVAGGAPAADQGPADEGSAEPAPADPRFEAADAALERGDYAAAVAEFDKLVQANPADAEAVAGRAQASLLDRSLSFDPPAVVKAAADNPEDVPAALNAADLEVIQGQYEPAFTRLIGLIRLTAGDDREQLRTRVLELFEVVGKADPVVVRARRQLTSALF